MADTKEDIVSRSLVLLGEATINSFTDGSDPANAAAALWDSTVKQMLTAYPWGFTKKKRQLSRLAGAPLNEWQYKFQLPTDLISGPLAVYNSTAVGAVPIRDFEKFGDELYADDTTMLIDYQFQPEIVDWPYYFITLMEFVMAFKLAIPVTDQVNKSDYWRQVAFGLPSEQGKGGYFREARGLDAHFKPSDAIGDLSLVEVRR